MFVVMSTEKLIVLLIVLQKERLSSLNSSVWWSNFPMDVTNISFHDYCGSLSNHVCKFFVPQSSFIKKRIKCIMNIMKLC